MNEVKNDPPPPPPPHIIILCHLIQKERAAHEYKKEDAKEDEYFRVCQMKAEGEQASK